MVTTVLIVLVAIIVSFYVWGFVWRSIARRTDSLDVPLAREETQQFVEAKFSRMMWKRVAGPGDLNWRRRIIGNQGPVLSMTLTSLPGGTRVEMWMSSCSTQGGVPVGTELVALRKRKLIGLLTAR